MRTMSPRTLLLPLVLAACAESDPLAIGPAPSGSVVMAKGHASVVARPFTGRCETTFNPPPLPLPPSHLQVDTGICELAHLGSTSVYGEQIINFAAGTQSGERTFTAANGDVLRATHVGTSASGGPGIVRFAATITFVGGTGRFTHATGQARAEGTANLITRRTAFAVVDGWIAYDAADRR